MSDGEQTNTEEESLADHPLVQLAACAITADTVNRYGWLYLGPTVVDAILVVIFLMAAWTLAEYLTG